MSESKPADEDAGGFYRFPSVSGSQIVFVAEGDVWSTKLELAPVEDGTWSASTARRLTTCGGCRWPRLNHDGTVGCTNQRFSRLLHCTLHVSICYSHQPFSPPNAQHPDHQRLAFASDFQGGSNVYVCAAVGGRLTKMTSLGEVGKVSL